MLPKDKALQDANKALNVALEHIRRQEMFKGDREHLAKEVAQSVAKAIEPHLARMAAPTIDTSAIVSAIKNIKIAVPNVHVEAPEAPIVNVPEIKAPKSKAIKKVVSEQHPVTERFEIPEYSRKKPIPALLVNELGKPWEPLVGATGAVNRMLKFIDSTGKERTVSEEFPLPTTATLDGISESIAAQLINPDGEYPGGGGTSISGSVETKQVSGFTDSVNVVDAFGSTAVNSVWNPDNRLRVSAETDENLSTTGIIDAFAETVTLTGDIDAMNTAGVVITGTWVGTISWEGTVDGSNWGLLGALNGTTTSSTIVTGTTVNTSILINIGGLAGFRVKASSWSSGSANITLSASKAQATVALDQPLPPGTNRLGIVGTSQVSGFTDSVNVVGFDFGTLTVDTELPAAALLASNMTNPTAPAVAAHLMGYEGTTWDRVQTYSGHLGVSFQDQGIDVATDSDIKTINNLATGFGSGVTNDGVLRVVHVTNVAMSVSAQGNGDHGEIYSGTPVKAGGWSRTTNPIAVDDGDLVNFTADDVGRQLVRPMQVRDLITTAYVSLANGTETTFKAAGGAGVFHDLIYVMGANTSDAAVQVDFRSVTAGSIEFTLEVPSGGTTGKSLAVPWPQGNANNNWTADMGDFSGTTVYISGLFSKEV